jgi:protein SCO1/2
LLLVLVAICAAAGLGFGERWFATRGANVTPMGSETGAPDPLEKLSPEILRYPAPRDLQPFTLQAANGSTLTNADLRGKWTLLFLGFTHCPDVCPTALANFRQIEELNGGVPSAVEGAGPGEAATSQATAVGSGNGTDGVPPVLDTAPRPRGTPKLPLNYWFVSVDPERDTPQVLAEYTSYFSPSIVAATAPLPELERFARDVGVVFIKVPQDSGDYTIDHSMQILLLGPDGKLHAMWRPPHIPPTMLDDVALIASTAGRP